MCHAADAALLVHHVWCFARLGEDLPPPSDPTRVFSLAALLSILPAARPLSCLAKDVPFGGCSGGGCRLSWRRGWKVHCVLIKVSSGPTCYMPRGVSLSPFPRGLRFGLDPATDQKVQAPNDGEGARYRKPRDYPEEHG